MFFSKFIISEFSGIGPLINVFKYIHRTVFVQSGWRNCYRCSNAKVLFCFAVLYVNILNVFVNSNYPSFNQYLTLHVQCSAPIPFVNDIDKLFIHFFFLFLPDDGPERVETCRDYNTIMVILCLPLPTNRNIL